MQIPSYWNDQSPAQCYVPFKTYLVRRGFRVYPTEFDCIQSKHPFVDIAAKMGSHYWAFEYKSQSDSISRGIEQVDCYSEWFDYVVLVSERFLDHRNSENYWRLRESGAGLWFYDPAQSKCIEKIYPALQIPNARARRFVARRFATIIRRSG